MLKGYAAAYPEYVMEVPGGVARATLLPKSKIAVINGGGSGHFPAFCGIIGAGFMDATVVGDVFASPSAENVYDVAKAVENGSGVFILGGNYTGDKMNFDLARDRLTSEGIDARSFYVTDDIASASKSDMEKRRGNVGTFTVFKTAGAASMENVTFDDLVRITKRSNDMTRTMSVGLRGCTLPGAESPLFQVPKGKMEVGQGIHGEPGVYETDLLPAHEVAELLVEHVLDEAPKEAGKRIAVILDGLGSTKYEELFVVWGTVRGLLEEAGYTLVAPLVGEYVTSLDMEGIALSVEFLDEELEHYWLAPADTPGFRKGRGTTHQGRHRVSSKAEHKAEAYANGSTASREAAGYIVRAFAKMNEALIDNESELARIDSVAGDGDHGRGMVKGSTFAYEAAQNAYSMGAAAGSVLRMAGRAWATKAGGTSGVLWGSALEVASDVIGDNTELYDALLVSRAVQSACERIESLGGAHQGDKTLLDALIPFSQALKDEAAQGASLDAAWRSAAEVAHDAAEETAGLRPRVGRARPQAERSLGTPDAGAVSLALCLRAVLLD
jgi:dihydroxyacetone kinase